MSIADDVKAELKTPIDPSTAEAAQVTAAVAELQNALVLLAERLAEWQDALVVLGRTVERPKQGQEIDHG